MGKRAPFRLATNILRFHFLSSVSEDSLALPAAMLEALHFAIHFTASLRNAPVQNLTVKLGTEPPPPERKHIFLNHAMDWTGVFL